MLERQRTACFASTFISEMDRLLTDAGFVVEIVYARKSARDVAALPAFLAHGGVTGRHYAGMEFRDGISLSA